MTISSKDPALSGKLVQRGREEGYLGIVASKPPPPPNGVNVRLQSPSGVLAG